MPCRSKCHDCSSFGTPYPPCPVAVGEARRTLVVLPVHLLPDSSSEGRGRVVPDIPLNVNEEQNLHPSLQFQLYRNQLHL